MAERGARGSLTQSPTLWNEATKKPRIIRASRAHKRSQSTELCPGSARFAVKDTRCSRIPQRPGETALEYTGTR